MNRLDKFVRKGELAQEQSWSLDALGNWRKWDIRGSASGNLLQSRAHGPGDRIKSIANASKEASWAQPEYDQTGNLTAYPNPLQPNVGERVSYDAWNRPVSLTSNFTRLTYDGLGRLVVLGAGAEERRFTYTPDWRLLEEEVTPQAGDSYRHEYVWGIRGQDDLICREKYSDQGQLQERFYSLSDAQGNIVGIAPEASSSPDRVITYDPYGTPTGESDFRQLFGGYYYDSNTGLYLVRNRVYHPKLGRWLTKDPLEMVDGPNLYEYCAGDPVNFIDPSGEAIPLLVIIGGMALFGAVAGGASYAATTDEFRTEEFALYTASGAVAGSLGGAAFFGAAAGLGTLGFTATYSALLAGGASGFVGGFSGGFITTTGMHRLAGDEWDKSLQAGFYAGLREGGLGAAGGLAGGAVLARYGAGFMSTIASGSAGGIVSGGIGGYAESGTLSGTAMGSLRGSAMGATFAFGGRVTGRLAGRIKPLPRQPAGLDPSDTATGKLMIGTRAVNEKVTVPPRSRFIQRLVRAGILSGRVTDWPKRFPLFGQIAHHQKPLSLGGADFHVRIRLGGRMFRWGNIDAVAPGVHQQSHPLPPGQRPGIGVIYY